MSSPIIQVENLCKDYVISHQGGTENYQTLRDTVSSWFKKSKIKNHASSRGLEIFHALKDVSFEVQQGEVLGIIGRNGAGKSTLLKILSRITEPTHGKVRLRGRVASLLEVGTGFHGELTGRENIFLNGAILGMSRTEIRAKFDEIVDFSGVEKFLDTPVKRYSSGMYVRLAFAVAAHLEPEILIVDEVLAVGDQQFQDKCLGRMRHVAGSGRTVLFVSHNLKSVEQLCNRAIRLEAGRLVNFGTASAVVADYIRAGAAAPTLVGNLPLSPRIILHRFSLERVECPSRGRIPFHLELVASEDVSVQEIFILIHTNLGERVALLDLRHPEGTRRLLAGQILTVDGAIDPCLLVEGEYGLGLFLHADNEQREHLDLLRLIVNPAPPTLNRPPIVTQKLGLVLLDCAFVEHLSVKG